MSLGLTLVTLASIHGAFLTPRNKKIDLIHKGLMQALLILGFSFIVLGFNNFSLNSFGRINSEGNGFQEVGFNKNKIWTSYSETSLQKAKNENKPVIIDFYADWCAACLELEEHVFSAKEFQERTKNIVLLKMDATNESAELDALKKKYGIVGLPTVLFFDSNGNWLSSKTLTQFEDRETFLRRIEDLK